MTDARYGLVEAGGTKFVLGVARNKDDVRETTRIPTTTPAETIAAMCAWFGRRGPLSAIGVASFGPLELDPASPNWGYISTTTKLGWSGTDIAGPLKAACGCSVAIDTDVNGAALAEYYWGAAQGQTSMLYFTVGTGVGGGAVIDGRILKGLSHPEMGHIRVPRHPADVEFSGACRFHGDCLEGLASGPAIIARWGASLSHLPSQHPAHDIIAFYLAQAVVTMQSIFEPGRIVFGGGVMATPGLIDRVKDQASRLGGDYFKSKASDIVCLPALGDRAGLLGALALVSV